METQEFRLGTLEIDPPSGRVAGPGGSESLDRRVADVLMLLVENAGRVVTREELHERVWQGVVVTDNSVTRCIYMLRLQLSRAAGDDRYRALIETLPKRGYRLTGAPTPLRREWPVAIAIGAGMALLGLAILVG
jgi:DNA-binding winged helix-turn-helix (wHTH) protein